MGSLLRHIAKYNGQRTNITKHIHHISPTGKIAHRNDPNLPHECPACSEPYETNTHVILCSHRSRAEWRAVTIQKVRRFQQATSDPYLIDILQDGLTRFHNQFDQMQTTQYPTRYAALIESQNEIGWEQLYKGRWSKAWSEAHNQYLERTERWNGKSSGNTWVLAIGRLLLDQWLSLWHTRNEQRHGKDKTQQQQLRQQRLTSELHEIYTYKTKVCPKDRDLFHESVEHHLHHHQSLDSIENWIYIYKDAIKASAKQATLLGITQNRTILEYPMFNPNDHTGA